MNSESHATSWPFNRRRANMGLASSPSSSSIWTSTLSFTRWGRRALEHRRQFPGTASVRRPPRDAAGEQTHHFTVLELDDTLAATVIDTGGAIIDEFSVDLSLGDRKQRVGGLVE